MKGQILMHNTLDHLTVGLKYLIEQIKRKIREHFRRYKPNEHIFKISIYHNECRNIYYKLLFNAFDNQSY